MIEIIPGILEKEWSEIQKKLDLVKPFAKWVHIDLLDGRFAENTSFLNPEPFKAYTDSLFLEVHLMVEEPEQYIEPFAKAGFRRFIGHIEKMSDQAAFVARGELWGDVGLALDAETPLERIQIPFTDLDFLTIMTVKAGFSGQPFQKEPLEKCKKVREKSDIPLEIDGGVSTETLLLGKEAGVTRFVVTSGLFTADPHASYQSLLTTAEKS